jgi:hypothetical protein
MSQRTLNKQFAAMAAATAVMTHTALSQNPRDVRMGHTGITWLNADQYEANRQIGQFGFYDPIPPHPLVSETVSYLKSVGVKLHT